MTTLTHERRGPIDAIDVGRLVRRALRVRSGSWRRTRTVRQEDTDLSSTPDEGWSDVRVGADRDRRVKRTRYADLVIPSFRMVVSAVCLAGTLVTAAQAQS